MTIFGRSLINGERVGGSAGVLRATNPATGDPLEPEFALVGPAEVDRAATAAKEAFDAYRATTPTERAEFLEAIAHNLDAIKDEIAERAALESGLPAVRVGSEHGRTTGQLRLFATELRTGEHQGVRIEHGQPDRTPLPAPDLRLRMIPVGPVAVFGASNFPLAFSTAGGDTASALAAGCPVVVKGHNAHPGAAELAGQAIVQAVEQCDLPAGVFGLLFGPGNEVGQQLVSHPAIKAVGFTGSRAGGLALLRTAADRDEPIPVYAEMSSINPVVLLPGALDADAAGVASGFVGSLTLGAGQFCTNPGLVLLPYGRTDFVDAVAAAVADSAGQTMLTEDIAEAYASGRERVGTHGAELVTAGSDGQTANAPAPAVYRTTAALLRSTPDLQDEVFGAAAVLVDYTDADDLVSTLAQIGGQLTISVHAAESDHELVRRLVPVLERKAGRLIMNGWPTGVEVSHAMVHGGPFPATSDSRSTSVGTLAIQRWQRPVSYQDFSDDLLPEAVRDDNPLGLPRRVDGALSRD